MTLYIVYGMYYLPLLIIFIPLAFIIIGIRNGIKNNIISMIITGLVVVIISGNLGDLSLLLVFAPISLGLNYFIQKRKRTGEILLFSTFIMFMSLLTVIYFGNQSSELGLMKEFEELFTQGLAMQQDMFKEMGMTNYQILENMNLLEMGYEYMMITLPSIMAILSLFISYFNYLLTSIILRGSGYEVVRPLRFSRFKLPNNIILGTGIMFLTGIIMGKLGIPYHNALLANISLLVGFVFLLQGLSLVDFLLIKRKIKPIIRIIILGISTLIIPMGSMLVLLGMLDSIFDMRKIGKRKSL